MMPQLYIAAALTTLIASLVFGTMIRQLCPAEFRRKLLFLGCIGFTLSPTAYFFVRLPLKRCIEAFLFSERIEQPSGIVRIAVHDAIHLAYAPLTEEPAKLVPWFALLLMGIMQKPKKGETAALALTIGVSFAVGEFWLVANLISQENDPVLAQLPWYAFGGYISERLMTCFCHTLFALPTVWLYRRSARLAGLGLFCGMLLHYFGNAPIVLAQRHAFGWSQTTWGILLQLWIALFVLASLVALVAAQFGGEMLKKIWQNRMICPECGATYRQPILLGLNMGTWRYEPCGACRKWHWVTFKNLAPLKSDDSALEVTQE